MLSKVQKPSSACAVKLIANRNINAPMQKRVMLAGYTGMAARPFIRPELHRCGLLLFSIACRIYFANHVAENPGTSAAPCEFVRHRYGGAANAVLRLRSG